MYQRTHEEPLTGLIQRHLLRVIYNEEADNDMYTITARRYWQTRFFGHLP